LAVGEFRALAVGEGLSVLGDQLAKIALSVLVYQRTGSAAWSAVTYALTLLPPLVTGPVLSPLADVLPRRGFMASVCLVQAALVGLMVVPGLPLWLLAIAVAGVAGLAAPFKAAQGAVVRNILGDAFNKAGRVRLSVIREGGQLAGLASGTAVVAVVGVPTALLLDAISFVVAASLLRFGLRARPAARSARTRAGSAAKPRTPWGLLADGRIRLLCWFALLVGFTAVPDAVVMPLIAQSGAPDWMTGLLLGADCVGVIAGGWWAERQPEARQRAAIAPLAVLSLLPLVGFVFNPSPGLMMLLLVSSGVGAAYLGLAGGEFAQLVPDEMNAAANGAMGAAVRGAQGLVVLAGGVVADWIGSAAALVAAAGVVGLLLVAYPALRWGRVSRAPDVSVGASPPNQAS
jgi:MFS family permease